MIVLDEGIQLIYALASSAKHHSEKILLRANEAAEQGIFHASDPSVAILVVRCLERECRSPPGSTGVLDLYFQLLHTILSQLPEHHSEEVFQRVGPELTTISILADAESPAINREREKMVLWISQQKPRLRSLHIRVLLLLQSVICSSNTFTSRQITSALQILAGWSVVPDNKRFLGAKAPKLVRGVAALSLPSDPMTHSRNLAVATFVKHMASSAEFAPKMMRSRKVASVLFALLECCNTRVVETAVWSIATLASDSALRTRLWKFRKGRIVSALLQRMGEEKLQPALATAMFRLFQPKNTPLVIRQAVMQTISQLIDNSTHISVVFAAQTLKRISFSIPPKHKTYPELLDKLCSLSTDKNQLVRKWAVEGLFGQTQRQSGCFYLARTDEVLVALVRRTKNEDCPKTKACANHTLAALALNSVSTKRILKRPNVIQALVKYGLSDEDELAVQALVYLVQRSENNGRIAKNFGLVECLAQFGVSPSDNVDLKTECLACVITLAPFL